MPQSSTTSAALRQQYINAGLDYTGLAEFSDVSAFANGTNNYTLKQHPARNVTCTGLKPFTRVWARFDGRNIAPYCTPDGGVVGGEMYTDSAGYLKFKFAIPNNADMKFKGFKHLLEVSDVKPPNSPGAISSGKTGSTTRCGQYYYAPSNADGFESSSVNQTSGIALSELRADGSKVIVTSEQVEAEVPDYMSQTFVVQKGNKDEVALKDVYLWFKKKPAGSSSSIKVQIRETDKGGFPTSVLVASSDSITASNITVATSQPGSGNSNKFTFGNVVPLKNGRRYALTIIPAEPTHDFELWTAVQNTADVSTNQQAFFGNDVGKLYGSATGNNWAIIENEALKMSISLAQFSTTSSSSFIFENKNLEFLNVSDISPTGEPTSNTGFQIDEQIVGESVLNIDYTGGTAPTVGTVVQDVNSKNGVLPVGSIYAHGTIRSIISDDTVNDILSVKVDVAGMFNATANVYNSVGTKIGTTDSFTKSSVLGYATFVNTDFGRIRLQNSSGAPGAGNGFSAGEYIRGQRFGASAKIDGVVNPRIDSLGVNTPHRAGYGTTMDWYYKASSSAGILDSTWTQFTGSRRIDFEQTQKRVFSRSNKTGSTLLLKGEMSTEDAVISPIVDIDDLTVLASRERLSSNSTNEILDVGDAEARYVSRVVRSSPQVTSSDPTERLNIVILGYNPPESAIQVFIRAKNDNDSELISSKKYTQIALYASTPKPRSSVGDRQDIIHLSYSIAANTNGDNFLAGANNLRENTSNNGVIAYRSGDGSIQHGIDEYQLKVVYTKPENRGTAYSPEIYSIVGTAHKAPLPIS